ncbi:DUF2125 domain-containing protein [Roseisalinus antarcticus]|uniref:DUF2125 domain-containing protein n=1 Tax=Roseisalinus antarcticus TaxID=254357 RepID=A0A1Y5SK21_9RHOB|nr:DUF2125 domain-containing protein [Roseisalinus antarcticus]SLN42653.1 hypothetical protein ROA7023_01714 [Roseisalinus antarcticus]
MTINNTTGRAVLIASLLGSTAATADVTAQEVWTTFKDNLAIYGEQSLTVGSESMDGGVLTASDVVLTFSDPEVTVTSNMGTITFTEQGDGTVAIDMAEVTPMTVELTPTYGGATTINMSVTQEGASLVAGGTPEEISYDLTAARYTISLDSIEGETEDVIVNAVQLVMSDIEGGYVMSSADGLDNVEYGFSTGEISAVVDIAEDGGPGTFQFLGTISDLETDAVAAVPSEMDIDSPETAFVDGLSLDAGYSFGASNYAFSFTERNDTIQGTASAEGGDLNIFMDASGFAYSGGAMAPHVTFAGPDLPFPVDVSMAEYGYAIEMPLAATEDSEEFGLAILLSELSVNEEVWGMVDPTGMLSHDPATVSVDVSGTGKLYFDVLDPAQMQSMMMSDMPGELESLSINDLTISVAGLNVLGGAEFTFDNSDLETFGGFPAPEGSAELQVSGANQLIDSLVQMGLLPEDQVMGARMMMGMFANTVGDDQLESSLEVNDQGHIIVNGQRIQ